MLADQFAAAAAVARNTATVDEIARLTRRAHAEGQLCRIPRPRPSARPCRPVERHSRPPGGLKFSGELKAKVL